MLVHSDHRTPPRRSYPPDTFAASALRAIPVRSPRLGAAISEANASIGPNSASSLTIHPDQGDRAQAQLLVLVHLGWPRVRILDDGILIAAAAYMRFEGVGGARISGSIPCPNPPWSRHTTWCAEARPSGYGIIRRLGRRRQDHRAHAQPNAACSAGPQARRLIIEPHAHKQISRTMEGRQHERALRAWGSGGLA
jgi:hypothetical protein